MKLLKKFAYAKINLGLEVLHKRRDGFHEINTTFFPIELHDNLEISSSDKIEVITIPDIFVKESENIVFKAALKLKAKFKPDSGVKITIIKNIPTGAGLGGGSSDAAAALLLLDEFWELGAGYDELMNIAAELGSDVPFFLRAGAAEGHGRGEIIEYFDYILPYFIVTVNTGLIIPTSWAYQSLKRSTEPKPVKDFKNFLLDKANSEKLWKDYLTNDFEQTVMPLYKELQEIKDSMYSAGAVLASLSGSGSSVFGLFSDKSTAESMLVQFPDYLVHITPPFWKIK